MKIVIIASQKGGAGKSTLALHLAVLAAQDAPALAIDLDPQGSFAFWQDRREAETPLLIKGQAKQMPVYIEAAKSEGIETVIVDTAPHDSGAMADAMRHADIVLIPCRPSALDLHAVAPTLTMARTLKKPAHVVLSQTPPKRHGIEAQATQEARSLLEGQGASVAPTSIVSRAIAAQSVIAGLAVDEIEPNGLAAQEFRSLWAFIKQELNT